MSKNSLPESSRPSFEEELGKYAIELYQKSTVEGYFTDPLSAFDLAWGYVHCGIDSSGFFPTYLKEIFPELLLSKCTLNGSFVLGGDRDSALRIYLVTIGWLLCVWRTEQPISRTYGSSVAHWCAQHAEALAAIKTAMRQRARYLEVEEVSWDITEWRPGGLAHSPENKNLALVTRERFIGQRTWSQAAQTSAYALFGDFLGGEPNQIIFCRRCDRPFQRSRKTIYCSLECGHAGSSIDSRHDATARRRRRGLRQATKTLNEWLKNPHRTGSDWRSAAERAFGLRSIDGRYSRLMSEFIRASRTPSGSDEREKLLRSLLLCRTQERKELKHVQQLLDGFLANVEKARIACDQPYGRKS
jgi:hypothetical protein